MASGAPAAPGQDTLSVCQLGSPGLSPGTAAGVGAAAATDVLTAAVVSLPEVRVRYIPKASIFLAGFALLCYDR